MNRFAHLLLPVVLVVACQSTEKIPAAAVPQPAAQAAGARQSEPMAAQPQAMEVFALQHAASDSVTQILRTVMAFNDRGPPPFEESHQLMIAADQRTNSVIVRGSQREVDAVRELLEDLDRPTPKPREDSPRS